MSLFWVVGGEYTDTHFQETVGSKEQWFGPFRDYQAAKEEWSKHAWQSVDRCVAAATPVYKMLLGDGNLNVAHPDCGHDFPDEMRKAAYHLIDSVLRKE